VQKQSDLVCQSQLEFLIGIQTQNPIARGLLDRRVLLRGVAFPRLDENLRTERLGNLNRTVGRAGVHDDDLALAVADQWLHTLQRAADVVFFVVGDDDDGESHAWKDTLPAQETGSEREMRSAR